ncbi:redoxin domain-containing protein [Chitinophaga parva]|nr:redoxin domain-containing protein [Chitinophaga parva]
MMKQLWTLLLCTLLAAAASAMPPDGHPTLAIGSPAPDFNLQDVSGKTYSLAAFKNAKVLVVVFTCNHCPTAQAYEDRLIKLTSDYKNKGVAVVAINPNDNKALRLDELDFSDLGDSFEDMKVRAREKHFNFPYLYDGETQAVAHRYGPVATPHVFVFDAARKLRYNGRFDDTESPFKTPVTNDARNAIDALLAGKEVPVKTTKIFGCSVKWAEKRDGVARAKAEWAKEPVTVDSIDVKGIQELVKNTGDKLRLINVWATWCGPCTKEFPDFMDMYHMYRDRDFEFISISADNAAKSAQVLKFLQKQGASCKNYQFTLDDKYKLIEAIDTSWQGALPYTLLVEPGGKVVYKMEGAIDPYLLKKTIVNNHLIGKYP